MMITTMIKKINNHVPSLEMILNLFDDVSFATDFFNLVKEYIPEEFEKVFKMKTPSNRIEHFMKKFSSKYFILEEIDSSEYQCITMDIPVPREGLNYSDYEEFSSFSDEIILMLSLVSYPFYTTDNDPDGSNARIPLLDKTKSLVGGKLVKRIPPEGFTPEFIHTKLRKTKYEALGSFADWVHGQTGLAKLDNCIDDDAPGPSWDHKTVKELTRQEPLVKQFWMNITKLEQWLHIDTLHFQELLDKLNPKPLKEKLDFGDNNEEEN
ncbi:MAG: hypothetical protein PHC43_00385 [Candidatus Marinimicrobia bacterium]|nr:hypothetical protein [Candidatus Neomarinimicrobiota bacterium]